MRRTAEQIVTVIHRHRATAVKGSVQVGVAAWDTLGKMIEELEQMHRADLAAVEGKLARALAPPPPPPPVKKKVFVNGRLAK